MIARKPSFVPIRKKKTNTSPVFNPNGDNINTQEAAKILGCDMKHVSLLIKQGKLRASRQNRGGSYTLIESEVREYAGRKGNLANQIRESFAQMIEAGIPTMEAYEAIAVEYGVSTRTIMRIVKRQS